MTIGTSGIGGGTGAAGSGGSQGTGGNSGSRDGGDDSGTTVGAPVVKITSPTPLDSPTAGSVLVADTVPVLCTATRPSLPGAAAVDAASVKIAVLDAQGQVAKEFPGMPTNNANEYQASFVVTMLPNGIISFRCKASDASTPAKTGSDQISTFIDHGPEVTVNSPAPDSAYPLTGAVPFAFNVTPAPLAPGDPDANVTSVSLFVNAVMIPVVRDPSDPTGYKLSVDFNDTAFFPQPPAGVVPVEIRATDSRKPTAAVRVKSYRFALDGAGPVITLTKPKNQEIIGGKVRMEFSVVDALSGVDAQTVAVELNQVQKFYSPSDTNWTVNTNKYTFTFDSANVAGSKVQVTANITASDVAGNKSAGESVVLYLDNQPPVVDLDPGNVRQTRRSGNLTLCSESFDPLGSDPANDGARVSNTITYFRALVWDETNQVTGQNVLYLAGTDQSSVYLYLQPDPSTDPQKALLINNDSDPECDVLNTSPGGVSLPNLHLNPVTPQGNAFFDSAANNTDEPVDGRGECSYGSETMPPPNLCTQNRSDLTAVIRHDSADVEPVVYGIGGLMGLECTGTGWELPAQLAGAVQKEGWFCLAAVATDKVGNSAISPPLRICFDDPATPLVHPSCATDPTEAPPSCTDGCTTDSLHFGGHILSPHN
jgi:hypothetical protein